MNAIILVTTSKSIEENPSTGYLIGSVVILFIPGNLLYSFINPEKF